MPIAMETGQPPKLLQHSDNVLPQAVHPHLIACCPTMDLVAFVTLEEHVHVYRFGGQRVFAYSKKENFGKVVGLGWKFNGRFRSVLNNQHFQPLCGDYTRQLRTKQMAVF